MAYKKGGKQPHALSKCPKISTKVKAMAPTCTVRDIFAAIQVYQNAPRSMTTFYKHYRDDLESAKADVISKVGDLVIDNALRTDSEAVDNPLVQKDRHFILERKGGWNKTETQETREVGSEEEENTSAVNALVAALGLDEDDNE